MRNQTSNQPESFGLISGTYALLLVFGIIYNAIVANLYKHNRTRGYTALLVCVGTAVTVLACLPLIGWRRSTIMFGAFVASGAPMALGDIWRYTLERERQEDELRRLIIED